MLMTMTTSKRLPLFLRTIESLDRDGFRKVITQCVIIDDHSSHEDVLKMRQVFWRLNIPLKVIHNTCSGLWRHCASMNLWLDVVKNEKFVFHCEDDWEFCDSPDRWNMFSWALALLEEHDWIGQACLQRVEDRVTKPRPAEKFWLRTIENCPPSPDWHQVKLIRHWPSRFTLTPAITRVSTLKFKFEETRVFERAFGRLWANHGWLSVYHPRGFCTHIGQTSAYEINNSAR